MNKLLKKIAMALFVTAAFLSASDVTAQKYFMYVGTYTTWKEGGKGIYLYRFNTQDGQITYEGVTTGIRNPSFLLAGPQGDYLFAVNEMGNGKGAVSSFLINRPDGTLTQVSSHLTGGDDPCHLTLGPGDQTLFTANYSGGNISLFPVEKGRLGERTALITHQGHGPDASRQKSPHPHEVVIDPSTNLLCVPDLGLDKVFFYRLQGHQQPLPADPPYVETLPGSGPRHLVFSRDGREMYLALEMGSALMHFHRSDGHSPWEKREILSLLPAGADATGNSGAELQLTPDGKYLYASNRGHNSIALFKIGKNGAPVWKGDFPCGGKTPRFFTLDPSGHYLLVLNQDSDNMVLFRRAEDGSLTPTGIDISVPKPVCAVFVPVK